MAQVEHATKASVVYKQLCRTAHNVGISTSYHSEHFFTVACIGWHSSLTHSHKTHAFTIYGKRMTMDSQNNLPLTTQDSDSKQIRSMAPSHSYPAHFLHIMSPTTHTHIALKHLQRHPTLYNETTTNEYHYKNYTSNEMTTNENFVGENEKCINTPTRPFCPFIVPLASSIPRRWLDSFPRLHR